MVFDTCFACRFKYDRYGIFISFSFQAAFVQNQPTILALWIVGGLIALTGALSTVMSHV